MNGARKFHLLPHQPPPQLVSYLKRSEFIRDSDKKKRFTEAYTVRMTTTLIQALERENERLGGKKIAVRPSRARKIHKKKPSNTFIKFSTSYRPLFVKVLKKLMQSLVRSLMLVVQWYNFITVSMHDQYNYTGMC